ncbi:MAG: hypothetical protein CVV02_16130 [Firmicutes bacterium HGW-Firmicutes-7]|nr:MAG: hypothetical protein CVV02_16130 [Firmicutes bacterium HGW-Firmicutes-7]
MIKSKFKWTLVLGIYFITISSGVAFANEVGEKPSTLPTEQENIEEKQSEELDEATTDEPDPSISYSTLDQSEISEDILEKQREIDKYLFEDNADEISKKGFVVTHTGPFEDYIQIGITPFNDENAQYLYDIFGEENIKVIAGEEAEMYTTTIDSDGGEEDISITSESEEAPEEKSNMPSFIYIIGALIIIGGGIMIIRKGRGIK